MYYYNKSSEMDNLTHKIEHALIKNLLGKLRLPNYTEIPCKDPKLNIVNISKKVSGVEGLAMGIANKLPSDETSFKKNVSLTSTFTLLHIKRFVNALSKKVTGHSPEDPIYMTPSEVDDFMKSEYDDFLQNSDYPIMKELTIEFINELPLIGSFIGNLVYVKGEGGKEEKGDCDDRFIIDFTNFGKYKLKQGSDMAPCKAIYKIVDSALVIESLEVNGNIYTNSVDILEHSRPLFIGLLTKFTIVTHLFICHLEVAETFSVAVRKFISKSNPAKEFLWNYIYGTSEVNNNLAPYLINDKENFLGRFVCFEREGFLQYCLDEASNLSKYRSLIFPDEDIIHHVMKQNNVKTYTNDDCVEMFDIIHDAVEKLVESIETYDDLANSSYINELSSLKYFCIEHNRLLKEDDSVVDVITSSIYTSSVLHEIVGNMTMSYISNPNIYNFNSYGGKLEKHELGMMMKILLFTIPKGIIITNMPTLPLLHQSNKTIFSTMIADMLSFERSIGSSSEKSRRYRIYPSLVETCVQF